MALERKLQVFISSTYDDLQEERQAAVEAVLRAGHIPAGMELFSAGDESQMDVIRTWIRESDVFMLIVGGCYGSIYPKSGKSYIHLEHEFAVEIEKPRFSLVISEEGLDSKVETLGRKEALEQHHPARWQELRDLVKTKSVRFWSTPDQIKLCVMESLGDFSKRDLEGWVRGGQVGNPAAVADEIARLSRENEEYRARWDSIAQTLEALREDLNRTPAQQQELIERALRESQRRSGVFGSLANTG